MYARMRRKTACVYSTPCCYTSHSSTCCLAAVSNSGIHQRSDNKLSPVQATHVAPKSFNGSDVGECFHDHTSSSSGKSSPKNKLSSTFSKSMAGSALTAAAAAAISMGALSLANVEAG